MTIPLELIELTLERYQNRQEPRQEHINKIESGNLLEVDTPERIQKRLERLSNNPIASTMIAEAKASEDTAPLTTVLSQDEFNQIVQEQIMGQNDLMSITYLEFALQASRSVGRVVIRNNRQRVTGYGTGFMVSPRILLTNNHVLSSIEKARFSLIEFDYQSSISGQILQPQAFELDPDAFFLTSESKLLDYTLVAVKEQSNSFPLDTYGWNRLIEEQGKVILGEYVNIIQHPEGKPKQLCLRENQLIDLFDDFLHYATDTAYGSSGSPVFNDQWEVVGLHHSGVPEKDTSGNILTIDGKVWTRGNGEDRIAWKANEGIRASSIVKHVNMQTLSEAQRRLRDEMFSEQPKVGSRVIPKRDESMRDLNTNPKPDSDGSVTWTIPLQVSVRLGVPVTSPPPSATQSTSDLTPPPSLEKPKLDTQNPELAEDLNLLERARRGDIPYYDATADAKDRKRYYGKLTDDVSSLNRKELYKRLKDLVGSTHIKTLSYNPKTRVYPWVDLQPDLKIRSIYSQLTFEPEQIIQEDFEIEQVRQARLQEVLSNESSTEKVLESIEFLEDQLPYNCEHVVPQSWFNKKEPMKGDLHHLFACEVECNSFRGNIPFYEFDDFREALRTNCGKVEGKNFKFEPEHGKGEVARATFYFLLRYSGFINEAPNEYTKDRLEILLKWHEKFPVTEHEKHRNAAIFKKQGNRNPFIDFPEWAGKVDLSSGLG